jgi:hypothetical protein
MPTNTERIEALEAQIEQLLTQGNKLEAANARLQQQLANQPATEFVPRPLPRPSKFDDLADTAIRIDNRLFERNIERGSHDSSRSPSGGSRSAPARSNNEG